MKKAIMFCLVVFLGHASVAKGTVVNADTASIRRRISYFFTMGMGTMIGCNECKITGKTAGFTASTTHGLRLGKRLSVGAGIGFDAYEKWKTVPMFSSASWRWLGKKNNVFLQLKYGYAFASLNQDARSFGYANDRGGEMINSSIGYQIGYGDLRLGFSAAYQFQRVFSSYKLPFLYSCPYCAFASVMNESTKEIRTDMNRFVLGMTVGWK
jgi:hypothetical protein